MAEDKTFELDKTADNNPKTVAVCGFCRHHGHNPTIEFNFSDAMVYWLCPACQKMNKMDFSKPMPVAYPRTRRT